MSGRDEKRDGAVIFGAGSFYVMSYDAERSQKKWSVLRIVRIANLLTPVYWLLVLSIYSYHYFLKALNS